MAKVSGPLHSLSAQGMLGGNIVFRQTRHGPLAQKHPQFDKTPQPSRQNWANILRTVSSCTHWVNLTQQTYQGNGVRDIDRLKAIKPFFYDWNNWLHHCMTGKHGEYWNAAQDLMGLLSDPELATWDATARALSPPLHDTVWKEGQPFAVTMLNAGKIYFHFIYGLYVAQLATAPNATPPTYS